MQNPVVYGFLTVSNKYYACTDKAQRDLVCTLNTELSPVEVHQNAAYRPDWRYAQGEDRWHDRMVDGRTGEHIAWL